MHLRKNKLPELISLAKYDKQTAPRSTRGSEDAETRVENNAIVQTIPGTCPPGPSQLPPLVSAHLFIDLTITSITLILVNSCTFPRHGRYTQKQQPERPVLQLPETLEPPAILYIDDLILTDHSNTTQSKKRKLNTQQAIPGGLSDLASCGTRNRKAARFQPLRYLTSLFVTLR